MDCPYIPELNLSDFSQRLFQKVDDRRIPITGSMELTMRCNLHCQHCYLSYAHGGIPGQQELSLAEIQNILDQVVDEGTLWFLLTGGEPLVRRDFVDIYLYAKRKGLILTLFTNGTLITPRIADMLAEWPPFTVEITLYGRSRETYERVTGIPGSHARCLQGIELLLERDVPLKLKTMAMTLNQHEVWEMQDFAESLGVDFRFDPVLNAGLDGADGPKRLRLEPEEVVGFDLADAKRMREWERFCDRYVGQLPDEDSLYHCGAGIKTFHIDPYGKLSICMMARTQEYDLRFGSFQQGWGEFLAQVRFQPPQGNYGCGRCELLSLCGQCPGWASTEHGDLQRPVTYLCQVAHLRAQALGIPGYEENNSKKDIRLLEKLAL